MKIEDLRKKLKKQHKVNPMNKSKIKEKKINEEYHDKLKIIGITGSRGKSSVAYLLHNFLKKMGKKSVMYSSIEIDSPLSYTKEKTAVDNPMRNEQMLLNAIEQSIGIDADYLILEVNERAIKQGIVKDVAFDIRVLTNIIEKQNEVFYPDYVEIKKSFLKEANTDEKIIIGITDELCKELYEELKASNIKCYTTEYIRQRYGMKKETIDYLIKGNELPLDTMEGINFDLENKNKKTLRLSSNLLMPYSVFNLTCVIAILEELKVFEEEAFKKYLKKIIIPGRDEIIKYEDKTIIVSVNLVPHLEHLKRYQSRKEINQIKVVVGATGIGYRTWIKEFEDRLYQKDKEQSMNFAYKYISNNADKVYITVSDTGASNVDELLEKQASKVSNNLAYEVIKNRKEAIKQAVKEALPKDVIFISGRGNREIMCNSNDTMELFNDIKVVKEIIEELQKRRKR